MNNGGFNKKLDAIIKGQFIPIHNLRKEDKEILSLVSLIKNVDYSNESRIKDSLKRSLLKKKKQQDNIIELFVDELDLAAGGHKDSKDENKLWE